MAAATAEAAEAPPGHSRLCLKAIAPTTLDVMLELGTTTSEDIATMIINSYMRANPNLSGQETIHRRVYDVINVLSAAGVIDKVGKQVVWRGGRPAAPGSGACEERIRTKEQMLSDKVKLLTLYKVLIKRNFVRDPAPDTMTLPVILIGIRNPGRTTFTQSLNRCELEIKSDRTMLFLAPSDILRKIALPKQSIEGILTLSPDLLRYGAQLLQDID
jgi:hypothetical protein